MSTSHSSPLWRQFWTNSSDGMALMDVHGRILEGNRACASLLGLNPEELAGRRLGMPAAALVAVAAGSPWHGPLPFVAPGSGPQQLSLSLTPIISGNARAVAVVRAVGPAGAPERSNAQLDQQAEIDATQLVALESLARLAEHHDPWLGQHLERIRLYSWVLAEAWATGNLRGEAIPVGGPVQLARCSLLHDVGKIAVPAAILTKPGPLTADEFAVVRSHSEVGWRLLSDADSHLSRLLDVGESFLGLAALIARHHHERWDGRGYPDGLSGPGIPFAARIAAIADVYDALTSDRPYKRAWSHDDARAHLMNESGRHFDPAVVAAFRLVEDQFLVINHTYHK